jgi:hypothetical protein
MMGVMAGMLGKAGEVGDPLPGPVAHEVTRRMSRSCATDFRKANAKRSDCEACDPQSWRSTMVPLMAEHVNPHPQDVKCACRSADLTIQALHVK